MGKNVNNYFTSTRTASYSILSTLPLLLAYETLIILVNSDSKVSVRIGADIWIKQVLTTIGVKGHLALGVILLIIGLSVFLHERKKQIKLRVRYFPLMLLESFFFSIFLAVIISKTVSYIFTSVIQQSPKLMEAGESAMLNSDFWLQFTLSIGAGLYEELFFRVILVSILTTLFRKLVFDQKTTSFVAASILGALLFSLVHYIGVFGDAFSLPSFTFRFLFGLAFNILYIARGFGIVAWTHALYDIILTIHLTNP